MAGHHEVWEDMWWHWKNKISLWTVKLAKLRYSATVLFTAIHGGISRVTLNRSLTVFTLCLRRTYKRKELLCKVKVIPRQAEVAQGVPGRLRPRISWRFGTTWVVGRQPNTPASFTQGEIPGTHFQRLSRPQGTWVPRKKIPSDTTGNRSRYLPTSSAVP